MLLAEPQRTPWDLQFRLLGTWVRVSPFFWLTSVLLGWNLAQGFSQQSHGELPVGLVLVLWILASFISILVHEYGHAMAFRYFGVGADVVLYQFGGLAIPRGAIGFSQPRLGPMQQIVVSAAGPAAQLTLGLGVALLFRAAGYAVLNPLPFIPQLDFLMEGRPLASLGLLAFEHSLVWASVWWALLNLLPVYPLDGGQISRELFTLGNPQQGIRSSLILSIIAGGAVAVWGFTNDDPFLGIMFAMLAYSSYMTLQAYSGRGGFGGGW